MYLEASVKGAELYVDNGESVSLFPPDTEQFQEGWRCHWRQLMGPKVQLDSCKTKKPTFQAPEEGLDKLLFEVTLESDEDVITDTVLVFVGEVLGEVQESLGESLLTHEDAAAMPALGKVIGPKVDEVALAMDVGEAVADEELRSWTAEAEPMSFKEARGLEPSPEAGTATDGAVVDGAASEAKVAAESPEEPVMPKQGFAKMLMMVRSWIGDQPEE
jgi:hypothetical protein